MSTGNIHLIIGPMFARKTSTLIGELERYIAVGKRCIIFKHSCDTRYRKTAICTHSGIEFDACTIIHSGVLHGHDIDQYDVVAVSESQFYPDLVEVIDAWARNGKIVIAEGLSGDFQQKPFDTISNAISVADKVTHLRAICKRCCVADGAFTIRTTTDTDKVVVGGADKYIVVCRRCML